MNAQSIIRRMERFPEAVAAAVAPLTADEARRRPPTGAWSVVEIVSHLVDEESEDFRTRLELLQKDPAAPWPGMNPEEWAVKRDYQSRDLAEVVRRFRDERAKTISWLRALKDPDWQVAYLHPRHGPIRAGDLFGAWAAHDALHLRQIAKRLFELAAADAPGFTTRYAGEWGA